MYVKIKDTLINLDVIKYVEKLDGYYNWNDDDSIHLISENREKMSDEDINQYITNEKHFEKESNSKSYYGFYINYLNSSSIFVKLTHDLKDSKRIYNEFLKYVNNNESSIPEIK
jgi:hypothetical protein